MGKEPAYGGVVFRDDGLVLLFEAAKRSEGTAWGFAKGSARAGELPEQAALRNVLEKTGSIARVVARISGTFEGKFTESTYFRMSLTTEGEPPTGTRVRWANLEEARTMLGNASSATRQRRDLAVLAAAIAAAPIEAMSVPGVCSKHKKDFVALFRAEGDGWALVSSSLPSVGEGGVGETKPMHHITIGRGYPGCIHCASPSIFLCNRCKALNCLGSKHEEGGQTFVSCAGCQWRGHLGPPGHGLVLDGQPSGDGPTHRGPPRGGVDAPVRRGPARR
jgi:ADP-ribose pyrophosphatase YjhB (NUDIX family)